MSRNTILAVFLVLGAVGGILWAAHPEDAPHVDTEMGELVLFVRTDTRAALSGTSGDRTPGQTTSNGDVRVRDDDANTDLDTIAGAVSSGLPTYGVDVTGADTYATVVTAPARVCHYVHVSVANNGAIISLNAGTTDHFAIPPNTERLFEGLATTSAAVIQGKNLTAGNNYTNLRISVW